MESLDFLLRGAAIGNLIFLGLGLKVHNAPRGIVAAFGLAVVTTICFLLTTGSAENTTPEKWYNFFKNIALFSPLAIVWVAVEIFEFPNRKAWLITAGTISLSSFLIPVVSGFHAICGYAAMLLYLALVFVTLAGGKDDLVEDRRIFRRWFVIASAGLGAIFTFVEILGPSIALPIWYSLFQSLAVILVATMFNLWAFSPGNNLWGRPKKLAQKPDAERDIDTAIIRKLNQLMANEIWRKEGLSIGELAVELAVPEHRLRRVINQDLGFRNFPAFVNGYRVAAAQKALSDPQNASTTVLEIAYESGFASLGPFNKAFREATGLNPTEFRRSKWLSDSENAA